MTVVNVDQLKNYEESNPVRNRKGKSVKKMCNEKVLKKRVPIIGWLPKYNFVFFLQDIIAGVTVALTAIPQGIAYAVIAGLPPEYGLYASLVDGVIYLIFGSSKDITVGPTAVMSSLVAKYTGYSQDFAVLSAFLSGCVILLMGIFHLGFLVNFISKPVINGFTTAAAFQIAAAQLKAFFGLDGASGNYFAESMSNFISNIKTARLWDPILASVTVVMLFMLKRLGNGCSRTDGFTKQMRWFISMGRNAVVVIFGMFVAYILKITTNNEPLKLIRDIGSGLPTVGLPPFSTSSGNTTYNFNEMLEVLGPQSLVLPLVAILESVAIAKAFAIGGRVDATQEMIAVGLCNIGGSFFKSMPITGSFTRTALNYASGVQTPAGGVWKSLVIVAALSLLTSAFYYIPTASLAGLIMTAMYSMVDFGIFARFWRNSKIELMLMLVTMAVSLFIGLEYGIVAGIALECLILLYNTSKPKITANSIRSDSSEIVTVTLSDSLSYCAAEHVRKSIIEASNNAAPDSVLVIDGGNLHRMDSTVAINLMNLIKEFDKDSRTVVLLNFKEDLVKLCTDVEPKLGNKFVKSNKPLDFIEVSIKNA
ncbi:unnamed protein product [Diatraea saccharalis]|uniref:STAS domain-containing protein n=1 Tax=Diatraea saccharalis TaxID=40085 RepID=A0A9N9QUG2_9NEOP|nr:unnamed protein product [Diatraea saccharalis]